MKLKVKIQIESAHKWIDVDGVEHSTVIFANEGDVLDSEVFIGNGIGDVDRFFAKLQKLEVAEPFVESAQ